MRFALLVVLLLTALPGCDTRCVGPGCEEPPTPTPTPADDDDASPGDDDDTVDGDEPGPGILSQRSCDATLRYRPSTPASRVDVAGEWSAWTAEPMEGPDATGLFTFTIPTLPPGSYAYKYLPGGEWEGAPPASAWAKWVDGNENRKLTQGQCDLPLLQTVSASGGASGVTALVQVARAADGAALDPTTVEVTLGGQPVAAEVDAEAGTIRVDEGSLPPGKHSLRVWAADTQGRRAENEPLFVPLWVEDQPFTWEDGLIYFVFTDRFRDGDGRSDREPFIDGVDDRANYQGGDLLGVKDALDEGYFEALGANILWLSPVYENPNSAWLAADGVHLFTGFHGYWPVDPQAIETRFGDEAGDAEQRLRELIDAAHARGIRVMFDLVLNHVHQDHPWVQEHPEWFTGGCVCGSPGCGWDEHRLDCWFTDYLPDLNYRDDAIVTRQLESTLELLETWDVDAVRVDAAKHMDHVIMRGLKKSLQTRFERGGGAPFYVVGETFTGGDGQGEIMGYVGPHELDGQFDFPLFWSIRDAFAHGGSFRGLEDQVARDEAAYGGAPMSPFLGNHDVARFATEAAGNDDGPWGWTEDWMAGGGDAVDQPDLIDRASMALLFTLTQPGVPLLYYGDEIGLAGGGDPDNRRPMTFEPNLSANQRELLGRVRAIGQLRTASPALRRGARRELWVDDDVLVYALTEGDEVVVVAMNKGWDSREVAVPLGDLPGDGARYVDRLRPDRGFDVPGSVLNLSLGAWDYAILSP